MKHLIVIPGLGNDRMWMQLITSGFGKGIKNHSINFNWGEDENSFDKKLNKIGNYIDRLLKKGDEVSLLGTSAGGSAVINLFYPRRKKIHKVITVCAWLFDPDAVKSRRPDFVKSVTESEKIIKKLSKQDKAKIITIRPIYDDIVPLRVMTIKGASNVKISSVQHMISIFMAVTFFRGRIRDFLDA